LIRVDLLVRVQRSREEAGKRKRGGRREEERRKGRVRTVLEKS
jgi:hypothetical protein